MNDLCGRRDETNTLSAMHWAEFGQRIKGGFNRAPALHYLHGAFESDTNKAARISKSKKTSSQSLVASSRRLVAVPTKVTTKRDNN